jgi:hypothetical protein
MKTSAKGLRTVERVVFDRHAGARQTLTGSA